MTELKTQLIKYSKDEQKMTRLYETYPDLFEQKTVDAFSAIANKTTLKMENIAELTTTFQCSLIKSYLTLPSADPNYDAIRAFLELYLDAIGKYLAVELPRVFVNNYLQLLKTEIKLNTGTSLFTKAHANVCTLPKERETNTVVTSDIQRIIAANLNQIRVEMANRPTETVAFRPEKCRVAFDGPVLEILIQSQLLLQNQMSSQNYNNRIKTNNFLAFTLLDNK
jgi:hypothetical protein